jgi:hypothetical protein
LEVLNLLQKNPFPDRQVISVEPEVFIQYFRFGALELAPFPECKGCQFFLTWRSNMALSLSERRK